MFEIGKGKGFLKGFVDTDEYLIANTKEQISAFIMKFKGESETTIVNMLDQPVLTTSGGFIFKCSNQAFVPYLQEVLVPQQRGEVEVIAFVPFQYPKELLLLMTLFENGQDTVNVEIHRSGKREYCFIKEDFDEWYLMNCDPRQVPMLADSLVDLFYKVEALGGTSFRVIKTIEV